MLPSNEVLARKKNINHALWLGISQKDPESVESSAKGKKVKSSKDSNLSVSLALRKSNVRSNISITRTGWSVMFMQLRHDCALLCYHLYPH